MNQIRANSKEEIGLSPEEIFNYLSTIKSLEVSEQGGRDRVTNIWQVNWVIDRFELVARVGVSQIEKKIWVRNLDDFFQWYNQKERKIEKIHFKDTEKNGVEETKDGIKSQVESTVDSQEEKEGYTKILPMDSRYSRVSLAELFSYFPQVGDELVCKSSVFSPFDYIYVILEVKTGGKIVYHTKTLEGKSISQPQEINTKIFLESFSDKDVESVKVIYRKKEAKQEETVPLSTLKTTSEVEKFFQAYQAQRGDQFTLKVGTDKKWIFTVTGFCANGQFITNRTEDFSNGSIAPKKVPGTAENSKIPSIVKSEFHSLYAIFGRDVSFEHRRLEAKNLPQRIEIK